MAVTPYQQAICRLLAENRIRIGETYVAGGTALNLLTGGPRISRDIDLFHDTTAALEASWDADRKTLEQAGYELDVLRERPGYIEAVVRKKDEAVLIQWTRDSAYRFFPLIEHDLLGLALHPFDLATNKTLALVGRLEARDWVDTIQCHETVQPLGYLVWAACGKDPGFSPRSILEQAGRTGRYSRDELDALAYEDAPPDAAELARKWHGMLAEARDIVEIPPPETAGQCILTAAGELYTASAERLRHDLDHGTVRFHSGRIGGAFPELRC